MKPTESAQQRTQRICGMFMDWWRTKNVEANQVLLVGTGIKCIWDNLHQINHDTQWWSWFPEGITEQISFPDDRYFDAAIIRIPPEKERLKLATEVVASRLKPGGKLWLFGSNDEGIRSVQKLGAPFFEKGITLETRKHARIVGFKRVESRKPRASLSQFSLPANIQHGDTSRAWTYFPGTFAKGKLDIGSRLLLESIRDLSPKKRVLDLGCGTGILCGLSNLGTDVHALDRDYLSLEATRLNVPTATLHWSDKWLDDATQTFDLMLSNPPIHDGKVEDHSVVVFLIEQAHNCLSPSGQLWMVVQHRVPVNSFIRAYPLEAEVMQQNRVYKVWRIRRGDKASL